MIKTVIFDFDGTLMNSLDMCVQSLIEAISPRINRCLGKDEVISYFGLNEVGIVKSFLKDNYRDALEDLYRIYAEYQKDIPLTPGIKDLMDELKNRNIKVCMVTGKGPTCLDISLKHFNLESYFDVCYPGGEQKPNKDVLINKIKNELKLKDDEVIYVGDALSDVKQAKEASCRCLSVCFYNPDNYKLLSSINPNQVFKTVDELKTYLLKEIDDERNN